GTTFYRKRFIFPYCSAYNSRCLNNRQRFCHPRQNHRKFPEVWRGQPIFPGNFLVSKKVAITGLYRCDKKIVVGVLSGNVLICDLVHVTESQLTDLVARESYGAINETGGCYYARLLRSCYRKGDIRSDLQSRANEPQKHLGCSRWENGGE